MHTQKWKRPLVAIFGGKLPQRGYEIEALSLPFGNSRPTEKVEEAVWSDTKIQDSSKEISSVVQVW